MNVVSQDKKQLEFYQESKSALDSVEKKLLEYFQNLQTYIVPISSNIVIKPSFNLRIRSLSIGL